MKTFISIFQTEQDQQNQPMWNKLKCRPPSLLYLGIFYDEFSTKKEHYELFADYLVRQGHDGLYGMHLSSTVMKRLKPTENQRYGLGFYRGDLKVHLYCDNVESFNQWYLQSQLFSFFNKRHDFLKRLCILPSFHKRHKIIQKIKNSANLFQCYKGINGQNYQVQIVDKASQNRKAIIKEIQILRRLDFRGLQYLLEVYEEQNQIYILFEQFLGRSIKSRIQDYYNLNEQAKSYVCYKLLLSLSHIHSKGIIHKDIRPENIILLDELQIHNPVIANFLTADYKESNKKRNVLPGYMAPELFTNKPFDEKIDVFSLGIIFYGFFYGKFPFDGKDFRETQQLNEKCEISFDIQTKQIISNSGLDLLKQMLNKDPQLRISAIQALQHHWFINKQTKKQIRNILAPPSLSTIIEKSEIEHNESQFFSANKLFSRFRIHSKSVDSIYIQDQTELETACLAQKVEKMKILEFSPSKAGHKSRK